jgi:hypothetical protein
VERLPAVFRVFAIMELFQVYLMQGKEQK